MVLAAATKWSRRIHDPYLSHGDFISWGGIGLIRAVESFDPDRSKFGAYAHCGIDLGIRQGLWLWRGGKRKARVEFKQGIQAGLIGDWITHPGSRPERVIDDRDELAWLMAELSERERECLIQKVGYNRSDREIGAMIGKSVGQANLIVRQATEKIREFARSGGVVRGFVRVA